MDWTPRCVHLVHVRVCARTCAWGNVWAKPVVKICYFGNSISSQNEVAQQAVKCVRCHAVLTCFFVPLFPATSIANVWSWMCKICWDSLPRRPNNNQSRQLFCYGVALVSRIDKITGLFCKTALWKRRYSAKETCNFIDSTNCSHTISPMRCHDTSNNTIWFE